MKRPLPPWPNCPVGVSSIWAAFPLVSTSPTMAASDRSPSLFGSALMTIILFMNFVVM